MSNRDTYRIVFLNTTAKLHQAYAEGAKLIGRFIAMYRKDPESEETKVLQKQIEPAGGTVPPVPDADPEVQIPIEASKEVLCLNTNIPMNR